MALTLEVDGCVLLRGGVDVACVEALARAAEPWYAELETAARTEVPPRLPPGARWLPSAASLGLDALAEWERLLGALAVETVGAIRGSLGARVSCDVNLAWLRRQYPPDLRPPGQSKHSWHQDGAYGAAFSEAEPAGAGLLPVVTAWIPFGQAGDDAPGLELVRGTPAELLGLADLRDAEVDRRWPPEGRFRPSMERGDVLLMAGHCLHRTHVTSRMRAVRTCADLRFVPGAVALPRLAGHRLVALPG